MKKLLLTLAVVLSANYLPASSVRAIKIDPQSLEIVGGQLIWKTNCGTYLIKTAYRNADVVWATAGKVALKAKGHKQNLDTYEREVVHYMESFLRQIRSSRERPNDSYSYLYYNLRMPSVHCSNCGR